MATRPLLDLKLVYLPLCNICSNLKKGNSKHSVPTPHICPWPLTLTLKSKECTFYTPIIDYMCVTFVQIHSTVLSYVHKAVFPYKPNSFTSNPENQYGSSTHHRQHVCQVWWKYTQQFYLYHVHKVISILVYYDLDLWLLTLKINRVHPLIMINIIPYLNNTL